MKNLLLTEVWKLRRSKVLWIAIFSTLMVAAVVYAQGLSVHYGKCYIDNVGWYMESVLSLATFFVLPGIIALLGSYTICREEQEDTLKSLRMIPVDESKLTEAKLTLTFLMSLFIYLLLFAITFFVEAMLHFNDLQLNSILIMMKVYLLNGFGIFIVISPIIVFVSKIKKGYWLALVFAEIYSFAGLFANLLTIGKTIYPITAAMQLAGYYEASLSEKLCSILVIVICGIISIIILKKTSYQVSTSRKHKSI